MHHSDLSKETKLSQAIEAAIVSNAYAHSSHFMCIALRRINQGHHVNAVHDMVSTIHKSSSTYRDLPLLCALDNAGIFDVEDTTTKEQSDYTTQLYCWWVFDLKRKGL